MIIDLWPIPLFNLLALGGFSATPISTTFPKVYDDSVASQQQAQCIYQVTNG